MNYQNVRFRDNWPAPNDYLLELGRMTTMWGTLESTMLLVISKLSGFVKTLDPRALILLAHSNFQQKIHTLSSLCDYLLPSYPHLKNYQKAIKKIESAQKLRNKYAHNSIVINEEKNSVEVSWYSSRGVLKLNVETVKIEQIIAVTAQIHEANCELYSLLTQKELKPIWERT